MFRNVFKTGIRGIYSVSDNPSFVSEPWAIYPAKHKTSGRIVSVFIFDKTKFEGQVNRLFTNSSSAKNPKVIIRECYELIKHEVNQLSKLKHPQILTIYEVLEETKTKFIFVSEPVTDNLLTINIAKDLDELSIQKGLLQTAKSLQFLHNLCSIIHFNLQPSSIFINNQGDWKLAGFKFLQNLNEISPSERENFYIMNNSSMVPFANLNLNFTAPELLIDSQSKLDVANDIWSLGCIIYYLYNGGDQLINCFDSNSISDYKAEFRKFEMKFYNHKPSELKYLLKNIPEKLYPLYPQILARYPHDRITIDQFIDSDFFNGSLIKAMLFIDEFSTKSIEEKLIFLKGLLESEDPNTANLLSQFPPAFRTSKLLPLMIELLQHELSVLNGGVLDPNMDQLFSYSLTIVFKISANISNLTFQDRVYTALFKDDPKNKQNPQAFTKLCNASVKTRLTLVENLSVLQDRLQEKQFVELIKSILDLVLTSSSTEAAQKSDQIKLQETFLQYLTHVVEKIEFPYIKNTLFPLICQVFKTTTVLSTKLVTIDTFEMMVDKKIIDKIIVNDQLFPIVKNLKSRDKRIVRKMLSFFVKLSKSDHISLQLESIVDSILPQCLSLAFSCGDCSQSEFRQFMTIINEIQKHLVDTKLQTLPVSAPTRSGVNGTVHEETNFESLINTQAITEGNKEQIFKGPQTKTIMQPRKASQQRPPVPSQKPIPKLPPKPAAPLTLKPATPHKPTPHLSFGASSTTSNATNSKLLNTLNSTYANKEAPFADDEFEDFQQAEPSSGINWSTEVSKTSHVPSSPMQPSRITQKNSLPLTPNPNGSRTVPTPKATPSNYPPGFDSNLVLTPHSNSSPKPRAVSGNATNGVKGDDLLDFI
ncbi:kinase-like domain-containing protein [Scheffersomyces xylosifermentans]|uniref:kinase-like domain-containing protein n=1 Tax=Scheffersomyces xylosifermentans TaxID=1304137 RepID=UPI00315CE58B